MKLSLASLLVAGALTVTPANMGCSKVNFPQLDTAAQIVLNDLIAHKTLAQIETDVAAVSPAGADVIALTDDTIQLLADLGLIPTGILPYAQAMHTTLAAQRVAGTKMLAPAHP